MGVGKIEVFKMLISILCALSSANSRAVDIYWKTGGKICSDCHPGCVTSTWLFFLWLRLFSLIRFRFGPFHSIQIESLTFRKVFLRLIKGTGFTKGCHNLKSLLAFLLVMFRGDLASASVLSQFFSVDKVSSKKGTLPRASTNKQNFII